jgi:thymidylate kinase
MQRGKFIVIEGMDGVGKSEFLNVFIEESKNDGKRVFDVHNFWKEHNYHPHVNDIIGKYDIIITSEPTFVTVGKVVREELISKNGRDYSPESVADAYALDRRILYEQLLLPCLEAGITVFQSRSFSTSIVFQRLSAQKLGQVLSFDSILKIPGNAFCYAHPFNFLIIPTVDNVEKVIERISKRDKDDNCIFENLEFQTQVKIAFESEEFQEVFTRVGTKVVYLDAGKTLEHSKEQALDFYNNNFREK